jgi:hypothetical protein
MRTRNRFLPVLLLVLAASTLAAITAPVAKAYMRPPTQVVIINCGDPDDNGAYNKASTTPPSSGEPTRPGSSPSRTCPPLAPMLKADTATLPILHRGKWQLGDFLFYLLFQSPTQR